jgi:uncharacterized protein (DUF362 family)
LKPPKQIVLDGSLRGWPRISDTFSWVENTSYALAALKACGRRDHPRVAEAERLLLDRVCQDGGWNCGNNVVCGAHLMGFVPTTALAALALQGLPEALSSEHAPFVDLNLDSIHPVPLAANHTRLGRMFLPATVLNADLIVSMPKMKTHHWTGATLSLKNMLGAVPGVKYGWPKNILHWRGISESITDVALALQPGFAIIDGIEGMEGDGPLRGDTVRSGVVVMGDHLTAVDSTAARVLGLRPERLGHLLLMFKHGGTIGERHIQQLGEPIRTVQRDLKTPDDLTVLKEPASLIDMARWL